MKTAKIACISLGIVAACWTNLSHGQITVKPPRGRGYAGQALKNIQKDIQATQKQLQQAQQDMTKAAKNLSDAQASYKQAQSDVAQARKTLHDRIGASVGLPEAQGQVERAHAEYDKAATGLVAELLNNPDFQQLKQKMTEAEERLAALRKDKTLTGSKKREQLAAAGKEALHAKDAYHARIDTDPVVKPFHDKLTVAEERLKEVRMKLGQESKNDPELHQAESSFKQAKGSLEKAEAGVAAMEERIALLQERLAANYALLGQ